MSLYLILILFFRFSLDFTRAFPDEESYGCEDGEEFRMCGSCERNCSNRSSRLANCTEPCYPGCFCKEGLVRASDGYCILPQQCSRPLCREDEIYSYCGTACPANCTNYRELFCQERCKKGCFCRPGYVRGPDGYCIDPYDCPITSCGPNEELTDCINPCNTCTLQGRCYFQECKRGCDCIPGFFRNDAGQCIPLRLCNEIVQNSCPINEHYVRCVNTCNDCWHRGPCEQTSCQPGCDCNQGHFRNEYNECVPEYQCQTNNNICPENEEYTQCVNPCNDCTRKGSCSFSCQPGCECKKGFYRDAQGECIPAEFCGTGNICKENEEYLLCGSACPRTCENYQQPILCTQQCVKGCFCKAGYVRSANGTCVLPRFCPTNTLQNCPLNEIFYVCKPQCRNTCETFALVNNVCTTLCISGCFCRNGFVKRRDGQCVRPNECSVNRPLCPNREVPYECIPTCRLTCETLNETAANCDKSCRPGCFCTYGEVKDANGVCIPSQNCSRRIQSSNSNVGPIFFRKNNPDDLMSNETTVASNSTATEITTSTSLSNNTSEIPNKTETTLDFSTVTTAVTTVQQMTKSTIPSVSNTAPSITTPMSMQDATAENNATKTPTKIPCHASDDKLSNFTESINPTNENSTLVDMHTTALPTLTTNGTNTTEI